MRFLSVPVLFVPIFWLGRFVRARLIGWGFIAVLAVVAYFSARLALDTQYKAPRGAPTLGQKHAPDFTAKNFTVWRSSIDGKTQYQLTADSMVHYRDDLSSVLVKPVIHAKTMSTNAGTNHHPTLQTHIVAGNGLVRNDGELIQLTNAVKVTRTAPGVATSTLQSASLVVMPDTDWVVTRSPVTLTQGKNISVAQGGMEYTHTDADLQLKGPVRTTLAPK
jgi:lipopolysaccharide export system protein LptC